jgi:hypothetical protein
LEILRKTELAQKQALVSDKLAQGVKGAGEAVTAEMVKPLDMVAARHQLREQVPFLFAPDYGGGRGGEGCNKQGFVRFAPHFKFQLLAATMRLLWRF